MKKRNKLSKRFYKFIGILLIFTIGVLIGQYQHRTNYIANLHNTLQNNFNHSLFNQKSKPQVKHHSLSQSERINISTCFTPPSGCSEFIVKEINTAKKSIYMQAYGMSDNSITNALINAKLRGVKIRILLDRTNLSQKFSKMHILRQTGIEVGIDKVPGIAHNKVIIIDKKKVVTGSFNFTKSADTRNAENVIIIEDEQIANSYLQNWLSRKVCN